MERKWGSRLRPCWGGDLAGSEKGETGNVTPHRNAAVIPDTRVQERKGWRNGLGKNPPNRAGTSWVGGGPKKNKNRLKGIPIPPRGRKPAVRTATTTVAPSNKTPNAERPSEKTLSKRKQQKKKGRCDIDINREKKNPAVVLVIPKTKRTGGRRHLEGKHPHLVGKGYPFKKRKYTTQKKTRFPQKGPKKRGSGGPRGKKKLPYQCVG